MSNELEAVRLAHDSNHAVVAEQQDRIDQAIKAIKEDYGPVIATSLSVYYETYATALSVGFSEEEIAKYICEKNHTH